MSSAFYRNSAALVLCVVVAFAILQAAKAIMKMKDHIRWDKYAIYAINRMLPNGKDRDSDWDYVDQKAWTHLAGLKMWSSLAALCAFGILVLLFIAT